MKYFLLFVDDCSQYQWIYLLSHKSQVASIFLHFKAMVQRKFNATIKQVQNDGGTEFSTLETYLFWKGYIRRISCPHISFQNGVEERKNRHVVETGLSMFMRS